MTSLPWVDDVFKKYECFHFKLLEEMKKFYIYQCSKTLCSAGNHLFTYEICVFSLLGMLAHSTRGDA